MSNHFGVFMRDALLNDTFPVAITFDCKKILIKLMAALLQERTDLRRKQKYVSN